MGGLGRGTGGYVGEGLGMGGRVRREWVLGVRWVRGSEEVELRKYWEGVGVGRVGVVIE